MKNILDPYFLHKMGWIKPKTISRYCPFKDKNIKIMPHVQELEIITTRINHEVYLGWNRFQPM